MSPLTLVRDLRPLIARQLDIRSLAELTQRPDLLRRPPARLPHLAFEGRTTLFVGREKIAGKTTLLSSATARYSNSEPFLGEPTWHGLTLWLTEEHLSDPVRRLHEMGAAVEWVDLASLPLDGDPLDRIGWIKAAVRDGFYDLVIIDTLSALLAGLKSFDDAAVVAPAMMALAQIAREHSAAVVLAHHANKDGGYRGSTELAARVDVVVEVEPVEGKPRNRRLDIKGRLGVEKIEVAFNGRDFTMAGTQALPLEMRVADYVLQHAGCSENEIVKEVEGRTTEIRAAIETLVRNGRIDDRAEKRKTKTYHRFFPRGASREPGTNLRDEPSDSAVGNRDAPETNPDEPGTNLRPNLGHRGSSRVGGPIRPPRDEPDPTGDELSLAGELYGCARCSHGRFPTADAVCPSCAMD